MSKGNDGTLISQRDVEEDKELKAAFRVFNGYITEIDLRAALKSLGEYLAKDEIEDIIEEVDLDGDGRIDYNEFIASLNAERSRAGNE